jgi:hypothetical protein
MTTTPSAGTQTRNTTDLLIGLWNLAAEATLKTCNAEQQQIIQLFLNSPEWGAIRFAKCKEFSQKLTTPGVAKTKKKGKTK